jgi:hypothetical protein
VWLPVGLQPISLEMKYGSLVAVEARPEQNRGWLRYQVFYLQCNDLPLFATPGVPVGFVGEGREWRGTRYGPRRFMVVHNPRGTPFGACWRGIGFRAVSEALGGLADHVEQTHRGAIP